MNKLMISLVVLMISQQSMAQTDSSQSEKKDTVRVGNMVIVNAIGKTGSNKEKSSITVNVDSRKRKSNGKEVNITSLNDTLVSIKEDTIKVGRINIINKTEGSEGYGQKNWESILDGDFKKTKISIERTPKKLNNISTNWWIFDLGFANLIDHTPQMTYMAVPYYNNIRPVANTDLSLNNAKSSNVNIWIVQQKANIYEHNWNLKYGVGIEMYNFRFTQPISFSNTPGNYVYFDNAHFSKNKLFVEYLTVPLQLNFTSNPYNSKSFYASWGISAGYLIQSHTKQISEERGKKKVNGNFNLNDFKMATIGELGLGSIRLYGSYSMTNLFDKKLTYFDMAPFAIGIRFSKF
jgi:hypothetical protein